MILTHRMHLKEKIPELVRFFHRAPRCLLLQLHRSYSSSTIMSSSAGGSRMYGWKCVHFTKHVPNYPQESILSI